MYQKNYVKLKSILTEAYHEHAKSLYKYAYYKVSNHAVAKDLVQTTFLKTWCYLLKAGEITLMKAFLYHVLNNLIVDEYRKKKMASLDSLLENGFELPFDDSSRRIDKLDGIEAFRLINHIPEKYRRIMNMRYKEELTLEEISSETGQSRNTVSVQTYRGIQMLQSMYFRKV